MRRLSVILTATVGLTLTVRSDEPPTPVPTSTPTPAPAPKRYEVVSPKADGIIATAINSRGAIVGFEWLESKEQPGVIDQVPFYADGKAVTYLPLLSGYTATFPAALSDAGRVVGRASKPAPPGGAVPMRNQAFVWEANIGIRGLGVLPDDAASIACGITRDGRRISGFSVGRDRIRACVWDQEGDGWKGQALPHNFRLGTQTVVLSGNGKYAAALDGALPCLWTADPAGRWTLEVIGEARSLLPRAVNDRGVVVGMRITPDGLSHAAIWSRQEGAKVLSEPPGYVRSEAHAVNNDGVVVGMIDGPGGSKIGPNAFVYEGGQLRVLDEGGPDFADATAINDHGQVAGVLEKDEDAPAVKTPDAATGPK
jgi:uncharacterized membrane protein